MEVLLSAAAFQSFFAIQCDLSHTNTDGFLLGHKRGNSFFVETTLPSQKGFFSSQKKYFELKQKLDDKILGFYSFQTSESKIKKILAPLAYGKIFLRLDQDKNNRLDIKPFVIEYEQDFFLLPVNLKSVR